MKELLEKLKSIRKSYVVIQGQYVISIYQLDELIEEIETAQKQVSVEPVVSQDFGYTATCDVKTAIKHLEESFNKAQKYLDGKTFDDLKMACTELIISNAEARQMLSKLSV